MKSVTISDDVLMHRKGIARVAWRAIHDPGDIHLQRGAMLDAMRKNAVLPRRAWDKVRADQAAQLIGEGNLEAIHAPDADAATTDDRFLDEHLSSMVTAAAMRFANDSERSAGPPWTPERVPRKRWSGRLLSIVEQAMKFS